jgi:hypothetical protein
LEGLAASEGILNFDGSPEIHSILRAKSGGFAQIFIKIRFPQPESAVHLGIEQVRKRHFPLNANAIWPHWDWIWAGSIFNKLLENKAFS